MNNACLEIALPSDLSPLRPLRHPGRSTHGYERKELYAPEYIFTFVQWTPRTPEYVSLDGDLVKMSSLRYKTFHRQPYCVSCGIVGSYFAKERRVHKSGVPATGRYHLNLYAYLPDSTEILMTKDHIVPSSRGGPNHLSNLQTMCSDCNRIKGDNLRCDCFNIDAVPAYFERIYPSPLTRQRLWDEILSMTEEELKDAVRAEGGDPDAFVRRMLPRIKELIETRREKANETNYPSPQGSDDSEHPQVAAGALDRTHGLRATAERAFHGGRG